METFWKQVVGKTLQLPEDQSVSPVNRCIIIHYVVGTQLHLNRFLFRYTTIL